MRFTGRLGKRGLHEVRPIEKVALVLGAFACAAILFLIGVTLMSGPDLTRAWPFRGHPTEFGVFGAVVAWCMFYCWVVSWMLLDDDEGLSDRARRSWIILLILLNLFAGVAYIFSRYIRRRGTR